MIYRAEPNTLMLFNASKGITGAISGRELTSLKTHLENGTSNGFISRLHDLELLPVEISKDVRQNILKAIEKTECVTSPTRSFAVPESIHIDLTSVCPLNCLQCYKDTSNSTEMPFDKFSKIIDQAADIGVFQIAIGGGEPLLIKGLPQYVKHVSSYGMACTVTTSGCGITPELINELKLSGVNHIQVSLNGSKKEVNSLSRNGFDEAIAALQMLSMSNILFGINWVARMDNVRDFENIVALARKVKADNINILRYKPSVREEYTKVTLTHEAFYSLAAQIKKVRGITIKIDSAYSNLLCYIYSNKLDPINCGCGAGRRFMIIDPHGRFRPCSHMSLVSEEQDIIEYWRNSPDILKLRQSEELIDGECGDCLHLNVCSGCRAICETIYNDVNAGERQCPAFVNKELV